MKQMILALGLLMCKVACAQTAPAVRPGPLPVSSPEIAADHRVTFRLRAPKASEVTITGDFWLQQNRVEKLSKDADGVWSLTTDPLPEGLYSYTFLLDGVHLPDPSNGFTKPGISETQSAFFVPGPDAALLQAVSVPHGEVRTVFYSSGVTGRPQRMHIYLPPDYEKGKQHYPVVYLLHGGGDDDGTWESVGRVNFILDNLIAAGRAKPMIVAMPSLWALDPPVKANRRSENATLFQESLRKDVVPYIESHYRVLPGPAHRAVGGLGDGREFLPNLVWKDFDLFDSVLFVSGGADKQHFDLLQSTYPDLIDKPANVARVKFYMGNGRNDASMTSARNLVDQLRQRGYNVQFAESDNTHGWPEFRYNFIQFAQDAFK